MTLRPGQSVVPLSVEFLSRPRGQQQQPPQHQPQQPQTAVGTAEFVPQPMSRQASGSGLYGILAPLARVPSVSLVKGENARTKVRPYACARARVCVYAYAPRLGLGIDDGDD